MSDISHPPKPGLCATVLGSTFTSGGCLLQPGTFRVAITLEGDGYMKHLPDRQKSRLDAALPTSPSYQPFIYLLFGV